MCGRVPLRRGDVHHCLVRWLVHKKKATSGEEEAGQVHGEERCEIHGSCEEVTRAVQPYRLFLSGFHLWRGLGERFED